MTNLTDRYVDAAMRTVPEQQRLDLSTELRASIDDQIDARISSGEPRDAAERAVLTGLGDPDKLAAGYTDRPLWLVGPRYYLDWWRLLKLLWAVVLPFSALGIAIAQVLTAANDGGPMDAGDIGTVIGTTIGTTLSVAVHLAFWVTLVFFIVERSGTAKRGPLTTWSVDQLPEPRPKGLGFGDMVASLVFLAIAAAAIVWDRVVGLAYLGGEWMPVLNPGLWPWWIGGLFVLMIAEGALAIAIYAKGRWTWTFAAINTVLALAIAVPALWLLATGQLINPAFVSGVLSSADEAAIQITSVLAGFGIAITAGWDIVDGILKTVRGPKRAGRVG